MYREGHIGLSLLLSSPFIFLFRVFEIDVNYIVTACLLMAALSSIPDVDVQFEVKHRGITHTVIFGVIVGFTLSILFSYFTGGVYWLIGFIAGFGGTISHLIGDALTYSKFKPFYPFSNREVAYGLFKASSKVVNRGILALGIFTFIISYNPSIIIQLLKY